MNSRLFVAKRFEHAQREALNLLSDAFYMARVEQKLSQESVAFEAGVAVITYNTLERGFSSTGILANPTLNTIVRVLGALDVDPAAVFTDRATGHV